MAGDTREASVITDHAFEPRMKSAATNYALRINGSRGAMLRLPPNAYLCGHRGCNLAEAAHRETTIERNP